MNIEKARSTLPRAFSQLYVAASFASGLLARKALLAPTSAEAAAHKALEVARRNFDAWLIEAGQLLEREHATETAAAAAAENRPTHSLAAGFDPSEKEANPAAFSD